MSYLGLTPAACSSDEDDTGTGGDEVMGTGGTPPTPTVANLVAPPEDASQGTGGSTPDAVAPPPTVANLVAPPPTVANLVAPPPTDAGPSVIRIDATIANLVAPPPGDAALPK